MRVAAVECVAALSPPAAVARRVAPALADADESVRCAALLALHRAEDADVRAARWAKGSRRWGVVAKRFARFFCYSVGTRVGDV